VLIRPRLVIAGLSGGSGKTIVSLGLCRALAQAGRVVHPFKKGPDYIDAAWLGLAAGSPDGRPATNLDPFLMDPDRLLALFAQATLDVMGDIMGDVPGQASASPAPGVSVIEGNRGLYDGGDAFGSCSTAGLARSLQAPVVLAIDCTKMTRTVAAIVQGCVGFEPDVRIAGVILNQTAGERHRRILRESIEAYTDVPVLGMLPKIRPNPIPERHMGLISFREFRGAGKEGAPGAPDADSVASRTDAILDRIAAVIRAHVDLDRVQAIADSAPGLPAPSATLWPAAGFVPGRRPRIGVVRDAALWFYYPENLDALRHCGADIVEVSLLDRPAAPDAPEAEDPWSGLDGLYLGGGFPETQAEELSANAAARERVRSLAEAGLPIYAECGGFMYLCASLRIDGRDHPMAGVFPVSTELCPQPQGLGYVEAEVVADTPFFPKGFAFKGHEFHYSRCVPALIGRPGPEGPAGPAGESGRNEGLEFGLALGRGRGMREGRDGLIFRNTFAAYTHLHAVSVPQWAERFVAAARRFRDS
jgi:cobyrinic acid a,c-diamide synthase